MLGVWDWHVYIAIFKIDNCLRKNGYMYTCICIAESLHYSPEIITILLSKSTSIQKKKLKKMFLKEIDNQQGPAISRREFCSIFCHNLNGKRIDTCICKNK